MSPTSYQVYVIQGYVRTTLADTTSGTYADILALQLIDQGFDAHVKTIGKEF